ncbi:MAG: hypothetical protein RL477_5 [Pseudomonadota bacterium]
MPPLMQDNVADRVIRRFAEAKLARGTWETHWEQVAERALPSYAGSFTSETRTQGERRTSEMVDPTAALALPKFAAAMESMLTPRNSEWHAVTALDKSLRRNRQVAAYYESVTQALFRYRYAPRANFQSQMHEVYMSLGAFGTGAMFIDGLNWYGERGLRYRALHLGEIYFLENHQGIIDTALRRFDLTARQAAQKFKEENLPEDIRKALADEKGNGGDKKFWFVHCVQPRGEEDGYDAKRLDVKGMKFASWYVSETGKQVVNEGGFHTFPYPISRYVVAPGETYGRSPAMMALPAIKVLNEQKKTVLKQGHRTVDPVLLAHDDGVVDTFSLKPGAINSGGVSAEGRPLVHALPVGNLAIAHEMMDAERMAINDAFLVTLFQILVDTPQMTATEVVERAREKGALLSPTMGRQQSEFFGPAVERELDVLASQGLLPPKPLILQQAEDEYEIVYTNPLSRAARAEKAAGFMRWLGWASEIVGLTQDPSPLDWANWDEAMPELADITAVPALWVNSPERVAALRAGRAQQAQQQQMLDALPAAAGVMKALPKGTPVGG